MWEFVTQKGMAMENRLLVWVWAMQAATYRVKIATPNRNGSATYTHEAIMTMEQLFLDTVRRSTVGSITLTAPCGCSFRYEKTEHHADMQCDTHWVRAVFNGDIDE